MTAKRNILIAITMIIFIIPIILIENCGLSPIWLALYALLIPCVFVGNKISSLSNSMGKEPGTYTTAMKEGTTQRGFDIVEFSDRYKKECSLQKSSLATEDAIWLGVIDAAPKILASDARRLGVKTKAVNGWIDYSLPDEVNFNTRMHLSQEQAEKLIPYLQRFVDTGEILNKL